MYPLINLIKSRLKKYLPNKVYFFVYSFFKKIQIQLLKDKNESDLNLINFTKPVYKTISIEKTDFDILLDPNNGLVDKEIFVHGVWEKDMLLEIRSHLKSDSVCLDVGANIGQHSLFMAKNVPSGAVYSFEPVPKLARQIEDSVQKNNLKNVTICNFGLSDKEERKDIYLNNLNMGNSTFKKRIGASSKLTVETKIFDSWWNDRSRIDFIKIDVEGYEYYALRGMEKSIQSYKPIIIFEFSPIFYNKMGISNTEFLLYILNLGYDLYDLEDQKKQITKENSSSFLEKTTIQTNILCLPKN